MQDSNLYLHLSLKYILKHKSGLNKYAYNILIYIYICP